MQKSVFGSVFEAEEFDGHFNPDIQYTSNDIFRLEPSYGKPITPTFDDCNANKYLHGNLVSCLSYSKYKAIFCYCGSKLLNSEIYMLSRRYLRSF